jgi:hypothetical protein
MFLTVWNTACHFGNNQPMRAELKFWRLRMFLISTRKVETALPLDAPRRANAIDIDIDMFNSRSISTNVMPDFGTVIT